MSEYSNTTYVAQQDFDFTYFYAHFNDDDLKISNQFGFIKKEVFVQKIVSIRVRQTSNPSGLSENKKEAVCHGVYLLLSYYYIVHKPFIAAQYLRRIQLSDNFDILIGNDCALLVDSPTVLYYLQLNSDGFGLGVVHTF